MRAEGLEPSSLAAPDPKSGTSTNSATPAEEKLFFLKGTKVIHGSKWADAFISPVNKMKTLSVPQIRFFNFDLKLVIL